MSWCLHYAQLVWAIGMALSVAAVAQPIVLQKTATECLLSFDEPYYPTTTMCEFSYSGRLDHSLHIMTEEGREKIFNHSQRTGGTFREREGNRVHSDACVELFKRAEQIKRMRKC